MLQAPFFLITKDSIGKNKYNYYDKYNVCATEVPVTSTRACVVWSVFDLVGTLWNLNHIFPPGTNREPFDGNPDSLFDEPRVVFCRFGKVLEGSNRGDI